MTDDNLLTSETKRSYFLMLPLLVDDLNLTPHAFRLYAHIVRRVGNGGECWENTGNMALACSMSTGAVSKAKAELVKAGLIQVEKVSRKHGEFPYDLTTVIDIWGQNFEAYSTRSQCEQDTVHNMNSTCSQYETKYIPILSNGKKRNKKDAAERVSQASRGKAPREGYDNAAATAATAGISGTDVPTENVKGKELQKPSMRNHECIQAIKLVSGYYPPRKLYRDMILVWENVSYENKPRELEICFKTYVARYKNPTNWAAWYFDWFREGMAYVPDDIRRLAQQFRDNTMQEESEQDA